MLRFGAAPMICEGVVVRVMIQRHVADVRDLRCSLWLDLYEMSDKVFNSIDLCLSSWEVIGQAALPKTHLFRCSGQVHDIPAASHCAHPNLEENVSGGN